MNSFFKVITFLAILETSWFTPLVQAETVKVTSILVKPYLMKYGASDKSNKKSDYYGFIKDILDKISIKLKLDFQIEEVKDGKFGALQADGSYNGMMGEVMNRVADMAAAPITVNSKRREKLAFSTSIQNFGYVMVMKKQEETYIQPTFHERISHLYLPLTDSVWLMSLLAYFITSTVLFIIGYVNPYEWRRMSKDGEATAREGETFNCTNSFWFVVSSWALQGFGARTPRSVGGRTVVLFWWAFVIIFVATYIASLTNLLRINPIRSEVTGPIHNLEELSVQTEVKYGMLSAGATKNYFKTVPIAYMQRISNYIESNKTGTEITTIKEGVDRVLKARGRFAFIMESAMAKYYTKTTCDLYYTGDLVMLGNYAFTYRIGYKHAKAIDVAILELRESGELQISEDKWFGGVCENYFIDSGGKSGETDVPKFYKVDLGSFSGALIILLVGVVAGSIITGIEVFIFKKAEGPSNNPNDGGGDGESNAVTIPVLPTTDRGVTKL